MTSQVTDFYPPSSCRDKTCLCQFWDGAGGSLMAHELKPKSQAPDTNLLDPGPGSSLSFSHLPWGQNGLEVWEDQTHLWFPSLAPITPLWPPSADTAASCSGPDRHCLPFPVPYSCFLTPPHPIPPPDLAETGLQPHRPRFTFRRLPPTNRDLG